jgi:hypothetical protein
LRGAALSGREIIEQLTPALRAGYLLNEVDTAP